jgi:TRAP-type C4-dicarboxylate transport system permease small subunit
VIANVIHRAEQVSMAISVLCMAALMIIVCYDATGRYLFNAPLQGASEVVTYYLLISAAYFAVSSTYQHGDHIRIDLVRARLPVAVRAWSDAGGALLGACLFALIAYATANHALEARAHREFYPGYVPWPVWISYLPIVIGAVLLMVRLVHHAVTLIQLGNDPWVDSQPEGHAE